MLWSKWKAGPQAGAQGWLLVSFTDFTANGFLDLPGAFRAGLSLREGWPQMHGAVGIWLWAAPMRACEPVCTRSAAACAVLRRRDGASSSPRPVPVSTGTASGLPRIAASSITRGT